MSDTSWTERVAGNVKALQIIVAALTIGCIVAAVVLPNVLSLPHRAAANESSVMTWVAFAFFGAVVVARLFVPAIMVAVGRRAILNGTFPVNRSAIGPQNESHAPAELPDDVRKLLILFHQKTIVGAALLEGCAFFLAIAYSLERNPIALVLMILLILGIAVHFPTASRVTGWIEAQRRRLDEQRQFAR